MRGRPQRRRRRRAGGGGGLADPDRLGREFELTEARWAHVLEDHETDRTGREADVRAAVERPDLVTADAVDPRRECHYLFLGPGRLKLKVVVAYEPVPPPGTWAGRVITAYPTSRLPWSEVPLLIRP